MGAQGSHDAAAMDAECPECEGTGLGAPHWIDRSGYHHPAEPCPCCHGTGIEPTEETE